MNPCSCGFGLFSASPTPPFSRRWNELHRAHHIATFPDVDEGTRRVLDELVAWADKP